MADEYEVRKIPSYTKEDTWVRVLANGNVMVGITDYAQKMLKEISFVDLPEVDDEITQMEPFATAESVKASSDVYAPISGTIVEINEDLEDNPTIINQDPYDSGWFVVVKPSNLEEELKNLLSADEYTALIKEK